MKMVLAGILILLLLFSTLVSAETITPTPLPDLSLPPDQLPDLPLPDLSFGVSLFTGQLLKNDLLVELVANIPSNLKVNDKFWVDIYVTSGGFGMEKINLILTSSDDTAAAFTGNGKYDYFKLVPTYTGGAFIDSNPDNYLPMVPLRRYKLGSLEMRILDIGKPFTVNLDKTNSVVVSYDPNSAAEFVLSKSPSSAMMIKLPKTVCVSRTSCTSGYACGVQNNGCGGVISCGTCDQGMVCAGNYCAAPELLIENLEDSELCQIIVEIPPERVSDKVLLKTIGETLQGWGNVCLTNDDCKAGYSCNNAKCTATELSILSPIFTALKTWLSVKFLP